MTKAKLLDLIERLEEWGIDEKTLHRELLDFLSAKDLEEFLRDFLRMRDMEEEVFGP